MPRLPLPPSLLLSSSSSSHFYISHYYAFSIDLPDSDAAIAIAGAGQSTLHKLEEFLSGEIFDQMTENLSIQDQEMKLESLNKNDS